MDRVAGSRTQILEKALRNSRLKWVVDSLGLRKAPEVKQVSFLGFLNRRTDRRTFMGCNSAYGGSPFANSMAVIPKLQISAL